MYSKALIKEEKWFKRESVLVFKWGRSCVEGTCDLQVIAKNMDSKNGDHWLHKHI